MADKLLYSINEAACALGIGRTKLYELLAIGMLSSVQIGTRRLIKADSIQALASATGGAA